MVHKVVPDANVWFSRTLRDWVLMLELHGGPYKTYWTEDILAEALYRLRRKHPQWDGGKITDIRRKITAATEGGCIDDFTVDGTSPWTDPNDQHVHAAALACSAGYLLTADEGFRDPAVDVDALPYEVYRPDDFLQLIDDSAPEVVRKVIDEQVAYVMKRYGEADLCQALSNAGCPNFAGRVRDHLQTMDLSCPTAARQLR